MGCAQVTHDEAARGPSAAGAPELPLRVTRGKSGGKNPGLVAEDRQGRKFVVKFDRMAHPEMETSTNLIVNRIFWTLGYNVPNDTVFFFGARSSSHSPTTPRWKTRSATSDA